MGSHPLCSVPFFVTYCKCRITCIICAMKFSAWSKHTSTSYCQTNFLLPTEIFLSTAWSLRLFFFFSKCVINYVFDFLTYRDHTDKQEGCWVLHSGVLEDSVLLGYGTVSLGNQFMTFRKYCVPSKHQELFTNWCSIMSQKKRILNALCIHWHA